MLQGWRPWQVQRARRRLEIVKYPPELKEYRPETIIESLTFFRKGSHALLLGHCIVEKSQSFSWLYLSAILMVAGHPSSSITYPPLEPLLHPYLHLIMSSPICSLKAMLSTMYLEGLRSIGHTSFALSCTQVLQNVCWKRSSKDNKCKQRNLIGKRHVISNDQSQHFYACFLVIIEILWLSIWNTVMVLKLDIIEAQIKGWW